MSLEKAPAKSAVPTPDATLRAAVDMLRKHGEDAIADRALRVTDRPAPQGTVVVIGEVSRGKSSLVNTLVGVNGLAPVDTEITTSVYVRFTPATEDLPVNSALIEFPGATHRIPVADLADWMTVGGHYAAGVPAERLAPGTAVDSVLVPPVSARVGIDSPLLPGVTIVDTPGVGSLVPEHVEAAVSAARGASVLVMVCDATAPLSAPELAFLSSVSEEVASVVLVVTKTDLVMRQWRTIVAENRKLIGANAPRFAHIPIIGISNRIAEQAAAITDPERRERALAASGIPELVDALTPLVAEGAASPERNALQLTFSGLDDVRKRLVLEMKAATATPAERADIEAERDRLQRLKDRRREWRARLNQDITAASLQTDDLIRDRFDKLLGQWSTRIDKLRFYEPHRAGQELIGQMTVDLEAAAREVSAFFVAGIERIADNLFADATISGELVDRISGNVSDLKLREQEKISPWKNMVDPVLLSIVAAGGPLAIIPVVNVVAVPVWAGVVVGFRASKVGKENHRKWLTKAVNDMKADVRSQLQSIKSEASADLQIAYDELLERLLAESAKIINDAAVEAKKSAADREKTAADLRTQIVAVDNVRKAIARVLRAPTG
ncbi:dynamin family protein [Gordonia alkanivorans]|uniref:dynamin family protein n=1 Tax=Gordonia alkanivorans TaxID=84096 RepID=UPI0024B85E36|nr:dynamin family protein [Gordonia alkanivorans]MDJ0008524.1 dynamin family protein [Gordonia alkanivorans]MDJ0098542.1 dynamin family protein [Gordonia alkanivorans]MDJ0494099.1 dynamin family protein [Gordonia alkanivorans]